SDGTRWTRCGHFQRHLVTHIVDCERTNCERSLLHPRGCRASTCAKNFGPQIENDVDKVDEHCYRCRAAEERRRRGLTW
ncbi:hypothetical protein B0H14DRAFT_2403706, partial [Mycena olivaceomarginata]